MKSFAIVVMEVPKQLLLLIVKFQVHEKVYSKARFLANEAGQVSVPLNNPKEFNINRDRNSIPKQKSTDFVPSELEKRNNSKKPGPAGKAHSNVKNMISAFEGSLNQDARPSIKPPPKIYPTRKIEADSFLANSSSKGAEQLKESTAAFIRTEKRNSDLKDRFEVEDKRYSKDFKRPSTIEKAAFSQRMLDKYSKSNQPWNLSSARQHSGRKSITKEGEEEILRKDPREAEGNSNGKLNSAAIWSDDHCSIGSSGLWIFPGEAKCSCITTGSKQIMDLMGGFWNEANTHQNTGEFQVSDADGGTAIVANEDGKFSTEPKESIGPLGKVVKVVIMVGFATLVFLTGKRTYR